MSISEDDRWMKMALRLARRGEGHTSPNPMVGAVVVAGGAGVGSGWHHRAGDKHAEVRALEVAGVAAIGATLYVTLEPCPHFGRTPPCTDAIKASGIARVVVAIADPDPNVNGKGIEALKKAGIKVDIGAGAPEASRLNEAYLLHRSAKRPFVTYKAAITLDGRTSALDGSSKWITGVRARQDVQRLRACSDAVCVGIGTVLADDPELKVRGVRPAKHPLRVVVDSSARTPDGARVLSNDSPTLLATSEKANAQALMALRRAGVETVSTAGRPRVNLGELLQILGKKDVISMLLEGGPTLASSFAAEGLIDRYIFYLAPKLLGRGKGVLEGWSAPAIGDAAGLRIEAIKKVGEDLRIEAYPPDGSTNGFDTEGALALTHEDGSRQGHNSFGEGSGRGQDLTTAGR